MEDPQQEQAAAGRAPLLQHHGATDWLGRPAHARLGGWKCAYLILGANVLCFLSSCGILLNLVVFLIEQGESNAAAASTVTTLLGTQLICSLFGALISDAYLGRLWTLLLFQTLSTLCCILFGVTVVVVLATGSTWLLLLVSLYMMVIATGLVLPNLVGLGVDQLNLHEDKRKYFQLVAIAALVGQLLATTLVSCIDNAGMWVWGFWMSVIASVACLLLIAAGVRWFLQHTTSGNPFLRNWQVFLAALRKHRFSLPKDSALLHECKGDISSVLGCRKLPHTGAFRFLDKAAVVEAGDTSTSWHLCTVTQVEEFKSLLRALPVSVSMSFTSVAFTQISTLAEEQALTMNRRLGASFVVPPASLNALAMVSGILTGIAMTSGTKIRKHLCRCFRRVKQRRITSLQLVSMSLVCSTIAMVIAALVESYRLHVAQKGDIISIMWLAPQTILLGVALNLVSSGSLDFFFSEMSDSMRSIAGSLPVVFNGTGSYLNSIFVSLITAITTRGSQPGWIADNLDEGHADYYYWFLACGVTFGLAFHIAYARAYKYMGSECTDADERACDPGCQPAI